MPLHKWVLATHLLCSSKKGISSHQLHRTLGVTYKTAWFMAHRIREAMNIEPEGQQAVADSQSKLTKRSGATTVRRLRALALHHKMKIVSLVERDGKKRSFQVPNVRPDTLRPILQEQIAAKARLITDEMSAYKVIGPHFASHEVVTHSAKEYVRGDVTTNTVESSFSLLKRGLIGTFHHVGEQHLQRYATEFDFRWNTRTKLGFNDVQRAEVALKNIGGKRLTYRRPH